MRIGTFKLKVNLLRVSGRRQPPPAERQPPAAAVAALAVTTRTARNPLYQSVPSFRFRVRVMFYHPLSDCHCAAFSRGGLGRGGDDGVTQFPFTFFGGRVTYLRGKQAKADQCSRLGSRKREVGEERELESGERRRVKKNGIIRLLSIGFGSLCYRNS